MMIQSDFAAISSHKTASPTLANTNLPSYPETSKYYFEAFKHHRVIAKKYYNLKKQSYSTWAIAFVRATTIESSAISKIVDIGMSNGIKGHLCICVIVTDLIQNPGVHQYVAPPMYWICPLTLFSDVYDMDNSLRVSK